MMIVARYLVSSSIHPYVTESNYYYYLIDMIRCNLAQFDIDDDDDIDDDSNGCDDIDSGDDDNYDDDDNCQEHTLQWDQ